MGMGDKVSYLRDHPGYVAKGAALEASQLPPNGNKNEVVSYRDTEFVYAPAPSFSTAQALIAAPAPTPAPAPAAQAAVEPKAPVFVPAAAEEPIHVAPEMPSPSAAFYARFNEGRGKVTAKIVLAALSLLVSNSVSDDVGGPVAYGTIQRPSAAKSQGPLDNGGAVKQGFVLGLN